MKGKWKFNVFLGMAAALITFVFSFMNNTWLTSLIRSAFGFLYFFIAGYIVQVFLGQSFSEKSNDMIRANEKNGQREETEQIQASDRIPGEAPFQAIPLDSIHIAADASAPPEKMAEAIRQWTSVQEREG